METLVSNKSDPIFVSDGGVTTQRNFRYQHAYGVILLIASRAGKKPYKAIWCEYHDDLLGERHDGQFDAYQIKTRKPELGCWTLSDDALKKSIKRFTELMLLCELKIHDFVFVSNTDFLNVDPTIKDQNRLGKSPIQFFSIIDKVDCEKNIPSPFDGVFMELIGYCGCSQEQLFKTLKKIKLVKGPGRESFDTEIAHDHLPCLEECEHLCRKDLNSIRDELIQKVYMASSLSVDAPSRHWFYINGDLAENPSLIAKRIDINVVGECLETYLSTPFRYLPSLVSNNYSNCRGTLSILKKKFTYGGLADQILTMERRTLSTEAHLLGLANMKPRDFGAINSQIVSVVQGECDEALLEASLNGDFFGPQMLLNVQKRLKKMASEEPKKVEHLSYECLIGIAGLLTEECKVWWSKKFDLSESEAA